MIYNSKKIFAGIIALTALFVTILSLFVAGNFSVKASSDYEVDYVPIESVEVLADSENLYVGQSIELNVKLTPEYAKETVQNVAYEIIGGNAFANIEGSKLKVNPDAKIGGAITVAAVADGVRSYNKVRFNIVETPVESVKIINTQSTVTQGKTLQLYTEVLPHDATDKSVYFTITDGEDYARVSADGFIRVNEKLPKGDLTITVSAISKSNPSVFDTFELDLYVPAIALSLSLSGRPTIGEEVTLIPVTDAAATQLIPQYTIVNGGQYVESLSGNSIKFKSGISDISPKVTVKAMRDSVLAERSFELYVPTEGIAVEANRQIIKQGEMLQLGIRTIPGNATLTNLEYFISSDEYATLKDGVLIAKTDITAPLVAVEVFAMIDGVVSEAFEVNIKAQDLFVTADNYYPDSSDTFSDTVLLTTTKCGSVVNSGVEYKIISGVEFVDGAIENGAIKIKKAITAIDPKIVLYVQLDEFDVSGEIIIQIKILAQDIELKNSDILQVEPKCSYLFEGKILPLNSTLANSPLSYEVDVPEDIAEINQDGLLTVKPDADAGQVINISVYGPDGTIKIHSVEVKPVYATEIEIYGVFKADGTEVCADSKVVPGEIITFNAVFPEPYNVTNSQKVFYLELSAGDTEVAEIEGHTVKIKPQFVKSQPVLTVRVCSNQNDKVIFDEYIIAVYVPVTEVKISASSLYVNEGTRIDIEKVMQTVILPLNSDVRKAEYEIVSGGSYALIDGTELVVDDNVPAGNLTFTVMAYADGIAGNRLTFCIYVKTLSLAVASSNYAPQSRLASGDKVVLFSNTDDRATLNAPKITIVSGAEYISGNYKNGDIIGSTFEIRKGLTAYGFGAIKLKAEQDGIERLFNDIIVYVPVESFSLNLPAYVDRDSVIDFAPVYNGIVGGHVTVQGFSVSVGAGASLSGNKLYIDKNLPAGTKITVKFKSNEPGATEGSFTMTVASLVDAGSRFENVFGTTASFPDKFSLNYSDVMKSGVDPVAMTAARQIEEGGYTNITLRFNGQSLSEYGITDCSVEFLENSQIVSYYNYGGGVFCIRIDSGSTGDTVVRFIFVVKDGTQTYRSDEQTLTVFKKSTSSSIYYYISALHTQLSVSWGTGVTAVSELKFESVSGTGLSLTVGGILSVNSNVATYDPVVKYSAIQNFNGKIYNLTGSATLTIKHMELNNGAGTGAGHVIAIPGLKETSPIPVRDGYKFIGYYTGSGGSGTQYYSYKGNLLTDTYAIPTLYAYWLESEMTRSYTNIGTIFKSGSLTTEYSAYRTVDVISDYFGGAYNFTLMKSVEYSQISFSYKFDCDTTGSVHYILRVYNETKDVVLGTSKTYTPGYSKDHSEQWTFDGIDLNNIDDGDKICIQVSCEKIGIGLGDFNFANKCLTVIVT